MLSIVEAIELLADCVDICRKETVKKVVSSATSGDTDAVTKYNKLSVTFDSYNEKTTKELKVLKSK